jgi:hypothetical protein
MTTAEDEMDSMTVDVEQIVRSAYVYSHVQKILEIMAEGDRIYTSFPKGVREQMECDSCSKDTSINGRAAASLAISMAQLDPEIRRALKFMLEEVAQYISSDDRGESVYGMLTKTDMAVISEMVEFVQKIGTKSTRHLLNFLQGTSDGEHMYLLIKGKGRESEVRMRYTISADTAKVFEIE